MTRFLIALVAMATLGASAMDVSAQTKKCKEGRVLNPETGKCVKPRPPRGSY